MTARTTKVNKSSAVFRWKQVKGADGYLIYGCRYGKKNKMKLLKHIKNTKKNKKKKNLKVTLRKLRKGKFYKFKVVAYRKVKGKKKTIAVGKNLYIVTRHKKYTNSKSVKVKVKVGRKVRKKAVSKLTLKVGKSARLIASEVKASRKKKIVRRRRVKFESSNPKVVKINAKGKLKNRF